MFFHLPPMSPNCILRAYSTVATQALQMTNSPVIRELGVPLVELEGFEADDLIGTLARAGSDQGAQVFIVTGDEDLFQLVNDRVCVVKPSRGGGESETICDAKKVKEILGVEPTQVVDRSGRPTPRHYYPALYKDTGGLLRAYTATISAARPRTPARAESPQ